MNETALVDLVRPIREAIYEVDSHWHMIGRQFEQLAEGYGPVDMNPDYQRGHIWTQTQQERYIEATMRGTLPSSGRLLQFNCPNWNFETHDPALPPGLQCLDGLQRYTATQRFLAGEIRAFGLPVDDFQGTAFDPKRYRFRIAVFNYRTKAEVLQHYLAHNSGGTPHSEDELRRVRELLMACYPVAE